MTDIATRVHNHNFKIDPIVRSVIDTDFYKLLMAQSVLRHNPDTRVTFSLINRSSAVPLARLIDEGELREQLDHIRTLSLSRGESTWLRGNTFYGKLWMFEPDFMDWFENFRFPDYHLERRGDQYELTFEGRWIETMMWGDPGACRDHGTALKGSAAPHGKIRTAGALCAGDEPGLGQDPAAERLGWPPDRGFRHKAAARVLVAGLVRAGDARGAGGAVHWHVQLPDRHAP